MVTYYQNQDLISLDDNPSSVNPPSYYSNEINLNPTSNPMTSSRPLNQNIPPMFQNMGIPQSRPLEHQQDIQHQSAIPVLDFDKLPLSMKRNYIIQNNYPTGFIIFHSLSLLFIAFLMVIAEIVILSDSSNRDINNQIGGGLYSGGFLILTVFFNLLSISCRNFCMIITNIVFHYLSLTLTFIITVVFHIFAIQDSGCSFDQEKCQSDKLFITGVFLIGISLIAIFMCLYFSIFIQIRVVGGCSKKSKNYRHLVPILPDPQRSYNNPNFLNQRQ